MTDIRRVVVTTEHQVSLESAPRPEPGPGEALVRSVLVGVCGSDTHAQHGRHPFVRLPYVPGHEVVGVVEHVAPDLVAVSAGDRVVVEPTLPCWACKQCRAGRENLCENLCFFGCGAPQGGMAEAFTIDARRLHAIPDDMTDLQAALIEPLSTPVHAARLAGPLEGRTVVVLGAGTIGLLLVAVVRRLGAARVVVTDVLESKRARALEQGADAVVDAAATDVVGRVREALGESADVVFDCVAVEGTLRQAVSMALKGGTVVVVGVPSTDVTLPVHLVQDQQVRIQGSATYLPEDYREATEIIGSGAVDPDAFVTGQFDLSAAAQAFAASASGTHLKVLVRP